MLFALSAPASSSHPAQRREPPEAQLGPRPKGDDFETSGARHPILSAKTVNVVCELGAVVPGDYHPYPADAKKRVEKAIRKWGRFTLVEDPEQADLVLVVVEGTKKYTDSVENPKWYQKKRESWNVLVDRLLVFKGGKTSKADTTATLLWDSGEIEVGSFADVFRPRMPATATAIKFRKLVEALENERPK